MGAEKPNIVDDRTGGNHECIPHHCIANRAYEIYLSRGSKGGHAEGDWLTAEAELKELKKKAAELVSRLDSLTAA